MDKSKGPIQFFKFGSWWECFRCGLHFPGQFNPKNHLCPTKRNPGRVAKKKRKAKS